MTDSRKQLTFSAELPVGGLLEISLSKKMTDKEFEFFCQKNPELRAELDAERKLLIMPPVHFESGYFEGEIFAELRNFAKKDGRGQAFSPSTGFRLPDGSTRSADASWVSFEQINRLSAQERKSFAPVVPEFVAEIRSDSDQLLRLKRNMTDVWIANGVPLAWLLDPVQRKAYIYRADGSIQVEASWDVVLDGEAILPGFVFDLSLLNIV